MVLKAIQDGGQMMGKGISSYLDDTEQLRNTAVLLTAVTAGVYTTKTGAGAGVTGRRFIEAKLGKPSLLREMSRATVSSFLKQPISTSMKHTFGVGVTAQ